MKIERIFTENTSLSNSVTADKLLKDEKQILDVDAVVFDSNKQNRQQNQTKQEKAPEGFTNPDSAENQENLTHIQDAKGLGKKINILA